ncbi:MAG: hypothetical protein M0023_15650 [Desulfobacteraceae bacterium]|nr:hypothetical protein [Desulfobacteraceae bacterium]
MNKTPAARLHLSLQADQLGAFFPLLQKGVEVEAHVGCTLDTLLSQQWGIAPEYAAERITTIFLDSRPVDSLATAVIRADSVLALSGAMPGLVGATMRRGGYYAAMREGISYRDTAANASDRIAPVRVKLFNLLLPELGAGFLQRGITLSASELALFISGRSDSFWQGCRSALLDDIPLVPPSSLRTKPFPTDSTIRLSVTFSSP